ncbi:MAG: glycine zipper 2TM domain-containing protein [bacterium]
MHNFRKVLIPVLGLFLAGLMAACAPTYGGPHAGPRDYGRASHAEAGTIVSSRNVLVRSDGRGGAVVGAVAGGAAGAALGGDTGGSIAGGLAGALIGGILGSEIEKSSSAHEGIEYIIELDSGRTITVVQDPSRYYEPGTRVRVIYGEYVRVVPLYDEPYRGRGPGGPYEDGPYDGPYDEGPDDEGPYDEGPYDDGPYDDGPYDDDPYGR